MIGRGGQIELRLLGEVELRAAGQLLDVGAPRLQTVLAALAVDARRPVAIETLIDRVWDDNPPVEARNVLYSYLSRLRRLLKQAAALTGGTPTRIERRHAGYVLDIDPDRIDLHRFRSLVDRSNDQRGDDARATALAEALRLWRGTPLAGLPGSWAAQLRDSWDQRRLDTVVLWAQTEVGLGHADEVIGPVRDLLADHPLVEPLVVVLVRALAAAGRDAEALDCYATARSRLVTDLGTEPGPELRAVHEAVLRGELDRGRHIDLTAAPAGGSRPVPAQLPANVRGFTGRHTELRRLDDLLTRPGDHPSTVLISAVSGTAGVGKTALAMHWAHRVAYQFPDGQLHVNLRGFDPGGRIVQPAAALRGFLDALGVPPERIPAGVDAQTALYRSLLANKHVLVVIDNARDADHVRPLLPGTGTAVAVVTSRNLLTGLVAADGAHPLALDLLTGSESRELLEHRLGLNRVNAEPDAVEAIVRACARLPLALALVAARAAIHPSFPLAAVAAELADTAHQSALGDSDDVVSRVRAVFSWSYTTLTAPTARLFRLLGLHVGADTSAPAAASLAGLPPTQARRLLTDLTDAGLLTEHLPGRYVLHDLLRTYAANLAHTHETGTERQQAITRLLHHYIHTADAADGYLDPTRNPICLPLPAPAAGTTPERVSDRTQAMAWLTTERLPLLAA
ncbi:MAG: BTAD domain-containing putative transcriptional regulator, partial [Kibdelosporangium sp.]